MKSEADIADEPSSGGVIPVCITELLSSANLNPEAVVCSDGIGGAEDSCGVCCSRSTFVGGLVASDEAAIKKNRALGHFF